MKAASKGGFNALAFAAAKGDAASVKVLLAGGSDPNTALPDGSQVLYSAASFGHTAAAAALIEAGANPNAANAAGNTPLHAAAQAGSLELVKALLAKGGNPNSKTANVAAAGGRAGGFFRPLPGQMTPLMFAARAGQLPVMKALIEAGADPKLKASDGTSFLMASVNSANVDVVRFAYGYDQDVKMVTSDGTTLMHASVTGTSNGAMLEAQERVCKVVRFLAENGAPLDEKNAAGRTPIDLADILPIDKAVELLTELIVKSGVQPKSPSKR